MLLYIVSDIYLKSTKFLDILLNINNSSTKY